MVDSLLHFLEKARPAYLDDLRTLTAIDSGSQHKPGIDAVNDWLAERLSGLGFHIQRYRQTRAGDDLLATLQGQGQRQVLLLGHTDTVYPVGTAAQRPMTIAGDKILGPGACDMKGGLLSGLYACAALRELGYTHFERLSFLCVSDEESGERHSVPLIRDQSRLADAVLTLEAARANGAMVTARKAIRWYTIEAFGRAAHAGVEPEQGRNAILALAHHTVALHALNGRWPGATLNVGHIEGGTLPNVVPDYARMRLDLRAVTDDDMAALERAVHQQLAAQPVPEVHIHCALEEGSVCPAMARTPAIARLERLAMAAARELGFTVEGATTGGASDANFAAAEGTPVLDGLGPVGGLDHSPDEYILLSSIVPRTALLARLIIAITRGEKE